MYIAFRSILIDTHPSPIYSAAADSKPEEQTAPERARSGGTSATGRITFTSLVSCYYSATGTRFLSPYGTCHFNSDM